MLNNVMCLTDRGQIDELFKKGTWKKYLNSADLALGFSTMALLTFEGEEVFSE